MDPSLSSEAVATAAARIAEVGWAVLPGLVAPAELDALRAAFDEVAERERRLGELRGWRNDVYQGLYVLPQKHERFRAFAARFPGLPLARRVLGDDCRLGTYNGHTMTPGGRDQPLHPDHPPIAGATMYLQMIVALDDFTLANGCTRLIPGSHRDPPRASGDELERLTVRVEATAGSVIAWDAGLVHAGSANRTDRPRRALSLFFGRRWAKPHCDFNRSLAPEIIAGLDPALAALLGIPDDTPWYDWRTDEQRNPR
jgi:ectoine hydroxylase-related dioxygenase (phytanoyl-CoA dioxygenase family)